MSLGALDFGLLGRLWHLFIGGKTAWKARSGLPRRQQLALKHRLGNCLFTATKGVDTSRLVWHALLHCSVHFLYLPLEGVRQNVSPNGNGTVSLRYYAQRVCRSRFVPGRDAVVV